MIGHRSLLSIGAQIYPGFDQSVYVSAAAAM